MEILVIGATGRTGRHVVRLALNEGHRVTAFVRSPEKLDRPQTGVEVVQGDATDQAAVQNMINNHKFDVVVIAVGSDTFKCSDVRAKTTKNVIQALESKKPTTRLWVVSSAGTNESIDQFGFFSRTFIKTILKGHITDHSNQEKYIRASNLPYVIVRPTGLKEGSRGSKTDYIVMEKGLVPTNYIFRTDLAHFIVTNLGNDEYLGKAVVVSATPTNE